MLPAFSLVAPVWKLPILPELSSWGHSSYVPVEKGLDAEPMVGPPYTTPEETKSVTETAGYTGPFRLPYFAWGILAWLVGVLLYSCWLMITL